MAGRVWQLTALTADVAVHMEIELKKFHFFFQFPLVDPQTPLTNFDLSKLDQMYLFFSFLFKNNLKTLRTHKTPRTDTKSQHPQINSKLAQNLGIDSPRHREQTSIVFSPNSKPK